MTITRNAGIEELRNRRRLFLVLLVGLLVQAFLLYLVHVPTERPLRGDEHTYWNLAASAAAGHPESPDFVWPPLYTWLLAGSIRLFGSSRLPMELFQTTLFIASGLFLRRLVVSSGLSALAADFALLLLLADPQVAAFAHYFWPEIPFLFLTLGAAALLLVPERPGSWSLLAAGVAVGLATLAKSLLLPFLPLVLLVAALRPPRPAPLAAIRRAVLVALGVLIPTLPVAAWNGAVHGVFGVSNSGPFNLLAGLSDPRSKTDYDSFVFPEMKRYLASSDDPRVRNGIIWRRVADLVHARGFPRLLADQVGKQYYRLLDRNSFFTDQLRGGRLAGIPGLPGSKEKLLRAWNHGVWGVVLVLASFGLALATRRELFGPFVLPVGFLAYNAAIFLVLHVKTRYRIAFLPALLILASLAIDRIRLRTSASWPRLAFGSAFAAVLLHLAFADL